MHLIGLYGTGLDSTAKRLAVAQSTTLEELRATAAKWFGAESFVTAILRGKPAEPAPASPKAP